MDDNIKITGGIKMGKFMDTIMKNGIYGKYNNAEPGFVKVPPGVKLYSESSLGGEMMKAYENEHGKVYIDQDHRYNVPKSSPKAPEELVTETVVNTEIYRRAKLAVLQAEISTNSKHDILQAQRKQVAYGLDKYPEPLNANTWSVSETVDHIMDESIDKLHYLIMLRIKLEQDLAIYPNGSIMNVNVLSSKIERINQMIYNAIDELDYLVTLSEREKEACDLTKAIEYKASGKDTTGVPYQFEELW